MYLIDDEDKELVYGHKWEVNSNGYISTRVKHPFDDKKRTMLLMHRLVMGLRFCDKRCVDHINHDITDNRKSNLRVVTVQENGFNRLRGTNNSSGYLGVGWNKCRGKWISRIKINGLTKYLGYFDTPEEASRAYLKAKSELHVIKHRL
jgi:HNH endonuclease/AP2 domain